MDHFRPEIVIVAKATKAKTHIAGIKTITMMRIRATSKRTLILSPLKYCRNLSTFFDDVEQFTG